jgi:rhamnosyltransferase
MTSVLGVVILYNPSDELVANIQSYAHCVNAILVIDNSDNAHDLLPILKVRFASLHYLKNEENVGIAKALNQAANFAIEQKYQWLLTMDQDSRFAEQSAERLIEMAKTPHSDVGLYTPVHVNKDTVLKNQATTIQEVKKTMTSGNLLNLDAFLKSGPFEEKLFIDYVDHEYNFRLQKNGFKLIRVNNSHLLHNLGNIDSYKYLFFSIKTTNHNALRRYYITRNRFYVIFTYFSFAPKFFFKEWRQFWGGCWRILLLEKNKTEKFAAVALGTWHWIIGRYGKKE